jgi:hypothetical protein
MTQCAPSGDGAAWRRIKLISALRDVQDLVAERHPDDDAIQASTDLLCRVAGYLLPGRAVEESAGTSQWNSSSHDANPLIPPIVLDRSTDDTITGWVTFTPFYDGGGGAAHGGAIPLLFDHVIGRLTNAAGRTRTRTG